MRPATAVLLAALFGGWALVQAAEPHPAQGFLERVYSRYAGGDAQTLGRDAPMLFDATLLSLIRADQRLARGEVGLLDHDPICSCQDTDALRVVSIRVTAGGPRRANASVRFVNGGHTVRVRFSLVHETAGWRISDIREAGISSLKQYLEKGIARSPGAAKP